MTPPVGATPRKEQAAWSGVRGWMRVTSGVISAEEDRMLDSAAVERVAKIKVDVDKERKLVAKLEAQITEQRAKDLLGAARSHLDMVEGYFLDEKILGEGRAPDRMAAWLNEAEKALRLAREAREWVQGLVDKFGPAMKVVG
jgi:hypothetical protein